ncbi:MAG: hypothetical protein HY456_00780 [Parcubacteria group bacterium]|nr:hypothetical protein [Parcubacteria group bacterium]
MGNLSPEYYKSLIADQPAPALALPQNQAPQTPVNVGSTPSVVNEKPGLGLFNEAQKAAVEENALKFSDLSPEEQTSRFGGPVGSKEYYAYKADHPYISFLPKQIGSSFGIPLPKDEEWDKLSRVNQAVYLGAMGSIAVTKMLAAVPREIVKAPVRFGLSVYKPWANLAQGKDTDLASVAEDKPAEIPWLGSVPTYWKTYKDAVDSGAGPLAATLLTGGTALGDITIAGSLAEGLTKGLQPRTAIKEGEPITNTGPIKNALVEEQGKLKPIKKADSLNEYYRLPKTTAKELGGNTNNTFLKLSPAGSDSVELSVVQTRGGVIPRGVDYIKGKLGNAQSTYAGDFGPEIKLQSKTIPITKTASAVEGEVATVAEEQASKVLSSIPPKALKGFEKKPITSDQMGNLDLISRVNGIDPGIQDAVVRTIVGNKAVGELTQSEYVRAAQTLASFNNLGKYSPDVGSGNIFSRFASPQRYWMRTYEEKTGIPLYSEAYVPMEEAIRLRDTFRDSYRNQAWKIFGKYADRSFGEERRLIKNYMEGDREAILSNDKITPQVKQDLVDIADKIRPLYDKLGQTFGIPTEVFLKDYQPHIADLGGVYQIYKEGQPIPKELSFFADFKRKGSLANQVDDALAVFDIYTNAGSNKLFLNPALERVGALSDKLPSTIKNSVRSYVQEKLGYANQLDEWMNNLGTSINKKLGTNLPPDVVRQTMQIAMDTTYSGAMGLNPGTVLRNGMQYDLMAYPRLGPKFYGDALKTALTKEGMAEVRNAGFLVDTGTLYGQALTEDVTIGGRAANLYRQGTQATLQPFSAVEGLNRARTYWQVKYQFNDVVSKYNSGKLSWSQLENELDFNSLSPVDKNIIRQRLIAGDQKGAFEALAREIIDETQFPYRRGASPRIAFGTTGKLGTQFSQWNIEFLHTMGSWIKEAAQGHPEKLIRFAAASSAIQRSLQDSLGFDFTRSVGSGPFNASFSPFIKTSIDLVEGINNWKQGNAQNLQENKDNIARTLKSLGVPAGVEIQKWNNFWNSYNKGPIGPNGQFGVYDQRGRLQYWTSFDDIFWQMFGFPTTQKEAYSRQAQSLRNASFDYSQAKQKVLELYQQEKYDEANQLIDQYGIKISPGDFDQYYIPFTDRAFQSLPSSLKGQFAPQLYPVK